MSETSLKNSAKKGFRAPILNVTKCEKIKNTSGNDKGPTDKKTKEKLDESNLAAVKKVHQETKTKKKPKESKEIGKSHTSPTKEKKLKKPEVSLTDSQYEDIFTAVLQGSSSQHNTPTIDERFDPVANLSYKSSNKGCQREPLPESQGSVKTSMSLKDEAVPVQENNPWDSHTSKQNSQHSSILKNTPIDQLLDSVASLSQKSSNRGSQRDPLSESQRSLKTSISLKNEVVPVISPWGSHLSKQNSQASSILKELQASQASSLLSPEPTSSSEDTDDGAAEVGSKRSVHQLSQYSNSNSIRRQATRVRKVDKRAVLEELQAQRNVGLWVYCDRMTCQKQRYLPHITDPQDLPDIWYCHMNPDPRYNSCSCEEQLPSVEEEEDMIDNEFTCGSVVWARLAGFPWWPAMVDDDPDLECYYWLDEDDLRTVTWYHVVFFDKNEVTRAWIPVNKVVSFQKNLNSFKQRVVRGVDFTVRLQIAREQAEEAATMTIVQRLKMFSFIARYKGPILDDQKQVDKTIKKYKLKCSIGKKGAEKRGRKRRADNKENSTSFEKIVKREVKHDKFSVKNFVKAPVLKDDNEESRKIDTELSNIAREVNIKVVESESTANGTKTLSSNLFPDCEKQTENLNPESRLEERFFDRNEDPSVSETPSGICFDPKNTAEEITQCSNEKKAPSIGGSNVSLKSKPLKTTEQVGSNVEMTQITYGVPAQDEDLTQNKLSQSTIADFLASEMEDAVVPETEFSQQSEPFEE